VIEEREIFIYLNCQYKEKGVQNEKENIDHNNLHCLFNGADADNLCGAGASRRQNRLGRSYLQGVILQSDQGFQGVL
jgi:hypothetical protein